MAGQRRETVFEGDPTGQNGLEARKPSVKDSDVTHPDPSRSLNGRSSAGKKIYKNEGLTPSAPRRWISEFDL